jgi:quinoprotein glucose dehydrogenase
MTADEQRGIIYMTFGAPTANYYGGDRPGANLFGNSIVAVDAGTGKYKWHFQVVHHDLWDFDLPPAPALVDIVRNGKRTPALAEIGKSGYMFILIVSLASQNSALKNVPCRKVMFPVNGIHPRSRFP